jgi:hypothetical protein
LEQLVNNWENYQLTDFKAWLENNGGEWGGIDWRNLWDQIDTDEALECLIEKKKYTGQGKICDFAGYNWQKHRGVVFKWIVERHRQEITLIREVLN